MSDGVGTVIEGKYLGQPEKPKSIAELEKAIEQARQVYEIAEKQLSDAQFEKSECLNELNRLQKEFDLAVSNIRKNASKDTFWANQK